MDNLCLGTRSLEGLLGTVLGVALVADELGVDTAERGVLVGLGLLDTVAVSLAHLVVLGRVLRLSPTSCNAIRSKNLSGASCGTGREWIKHKTVGDGGVVDKVG